MRRWHSFLLVLLLAGCEPRTPWPEASSSVAASADAGAATDAGPPADAAAAAPDAAATDAAMPQTSVRLLVTLGSSSTAGAGASSPAARYTDVVAAALGATLVNLGSGGQTVSRVRDSVVPQVLEALDGGPPAAPQVDLVTVLPFTDFDRSSAEAIAAGYHDVLARLAPTGAWVVFGIPTLDPRLACGAVGTLRGPGGECYGGELLADYAAKDQAVRAILARHDGATAAEIWDTQAARPGWTASDGHPNDLGHEFIARCFLFAIRGRLGQDGGSAPGPLPP